MECICVNEKSKFKNITEIMIIYNQYIIYMCIKQRKKNVLLKTMFSTNM